MLYNYFIAGNYFAGLWVIHIGKNIINQKLLESGCAHVQTSKMSPG